MTHTASASFHKHVGLTICLKGSRQVAYQGLLTLRHKGFSNERVNLIMYYVLQEHSAWLSYPHTHTSEHNFNVHTVVM